MLLSSCSTAERSDDRTDGSWLRGTSVRILIASDRYPPFIGGAQRQTWLIAHELERREHRVVVATVWQDRTRRARMTMGCACAGSSS